MGGRTGLFWQFLSFQPGEFTCLFFLLQRNNIPKDYRIPVHYVPKETVRFCLQYLQENNTCGHLLFTASLCVHTHPLFLLLWLVFPQLHLYATLGWPYKYCTMHRLCSTRRSLNFNVTSAQRDHSTGFDGYAVFWKASCCLGVKRDYETCLFSLILFHVCSVSSRVGCVGWN